MNYREALAAGGIAIGLVATGEAQVRPTAAETPVAFEVASVKSQGPVPSGDGRGTNAVGGMGLGCDGGFPRIQGKRFIVTTTPYALITWAYGYNKTWGCSYVNFAGLLTGGPPWIRSERFEIQALMSEDSPAYTAAEFLRGDAPELEKMLQKLLADRFHLVVHRVTKEVPAYALVRGKGEPKLTHSTGEGRPTFGMRRQAGPNGQISNKMTGRRVELRDLTFQLVMTTQHPVIDRTGLVGQYDFDLEFAPLDSDALASSAGPSLFTAVQEQLGLKLENVKAPLEGLVIDRAERPSEN